MYELGFKNISYIRRALQGKLGHLKWMLRQDDNKELAEARQQIQEDILYYNGLLNTFETAEKQSYELREVASLCVPERRKGDPG